jgi:hypothetical protein
MARIGRGIDADLATDHLAGRALRRSSVGRVLVGVRVGDGVLVGIGVFVGAAVFVGVAVLVTIGVLVFVAVAVAVGGSLLQRPFMETPRRTHCCGRRSCSGRSPHRYRPVRRIGDDRAGNNRLGSWRHRHQSTQPRHRQARRGALAARPGAKLGLSAPWRIDRNATRPCLTPTPTHSPAHVGRTSVKHNSHPI